MRKLLEESEINALLMLQSGHCASNAQQLEVCGETDKAATSRLRREVKSSPEKE